MDNLLSFRFHRSFQSVEGRTQYEYICTRCNSWTDDVPFSMSVEKRIEILNRDHPKEDCDLLIIETVQNS